MGCNDNTNERNAAIKGYDEPSGSKEILGLVRCHLIDERVAPVRQSDFAMTSVYFDALKNALPSRWG